MRLTHGEIIGIVSQEIKWHRRNPDKELSQDYQSGFIAGLAHVQTLLKQILTDHGLMELPATTHPADEEPNGLSSEES